MTNSAITKKPLRIVHFNYDWRNLFENDPDMVIKKYQRDLLFPESNSFFTISWSTKSYKKKISDTIYTVHMGARFKWFKPLYDFLLIFRAKHLVMEHGFVPDIILVYEAPFLPAAYALKRAVGGRVVFCLTNLPVEYSSTRRFGYMKAFYSWIFLKMSGMFTDYVYTINDAVKSYILKHASIPESRIRIFVSDTIAQDRMSNMMQETERIDIKKKHGITKEALIFSVGRIQPEKGFERLFTAIASFQHLDVKLCIAGGRTDEKYFQTLVKLLQKLGIEEKVIFLGELSRSEIWQYYAQADAFVLLSRAEALGLVFWEAMYAGCPVLGSKASGIVESLGEYEERGYLWSESDGMNSFAEKLLAMLEKQEETQKKIRKAKKYVEEKMSQTYSIIDLAEEMV
jgi:glycosyltransferase involved in cell wall biosynthesis